MNKKLLLSTLLFLSLVVQSQCQVVFAYTDYAAKDDTFRISKADSLWFVNFDTTGVGITWDYSALMPYTQNVEKVLAPNSTGYVFTPPSFQSGLDRAEPISDTLYIGSIELSNTYNFFDLSSTQYKQMAKASKVEGVDMKTKFDTADVVYRFPMQYGNSKDSSNSSYTTSISSLLYYHHSQKRVNEIEGEGTLVTPYGSFSALKLKSTLYITDTFSVDSFGIPKYSYQEIEYKWFSPNFGYPLLYVKKEIVSGITISVTAEYLDSVRYFIPTATFAYYPESPVQGDAITFQNLSTNATSYHWDFDDGNTSTDVNPSHTYADTGTYIVQLISSNPTSADTFNLPIFVTDSNAIIAYFTYTPQYPCYTEDTITFVNTSYNATSYLWDFGDGHTSTAEDTAYAYANPGIYNVKLIAYKTGSSDTMIATINYAQIPQASFTTDSEAISPVIFTNTSLGIDTNTTYYWDFGFGSTPSSSTEKNPIVSYSFIGDKTVYLITYNSAGCSSTYMTSIHVAGIDTSSVVSYFSFSPENPCFGEDSISFMNESFNANSYLWNFGDGKYSAQTNPVHAYDSAGVYTVHLIAYNNSSSDTSTVQINYVAVPQASFTMSDSLINISIVFTNTSIGTDTLSTYYWEFGADASPATSTDMNPTVSYSLPGDKTISLTAFNSVGCYSTNTIVKNVAGTLTNITASSNTINKLSINNYNNTLHIYYSLSEKTQMQCSIYNLLGKCVYTQNMHEQLKGEHTISLPFNANGMYVVQLSTGSGEKMSKKFVSVNR